MKSITEKILESNIISEASDQNCEVYAGVTDETYDVFMYKFEVRAFDGLDCLYKIYQKDILFFDFDTEPEDIEKMQSETNASKRQKYIKELSDSAFKSGTKIYQIKVGSRVVYEDDNYREQKI